MARYDSRHESGTDESNANYFEHPQGLSLPSMTYLWFYRVQNKSIVPSPEGVARPFYRAKGKKPYRNTHWLAHTTLHATALAHHKEQKIPALRLSPRGVGLRYGSGETA